MAPPPQPPPPPPPPPPPLLVWRGGARGLRKARPDTPDRTLLMTDTAESGVTPDRTYPSSVELNAGAGEALEQSNGKGPKSFLSVLGLGACEKEPAAA